MKNGVVLEEAEIPLAANGQEAQYIEELFTGTDTSVFVARYTARHRPGRRCLPESPWSLMKTAASLRDPAGVAP